MSVTDKDRAELKELTNQIRKSNQPMQWFDYGWDDCAEIIMRYVEKKNAESAEQARKEAAERAVRFFDDFRICVPPNKYNMPQETLEQLRSAILGDTVKEGKTDAEKLDIAVKALEKINERHSFADIVDDSYTISRDALREIQE